MTPFFNPTKSTHTTNSTLSFSPLNLRFVESTWGFPYSQGMEMVENYIQYKRIGVIEVGNS
jgi:hypothetical protein